MRRQKDYPRELLINGNLWRVEFKRKLQHDGKSCLGLCDPEERVISILMGQTMRERLSTFQHETVHAWEAEYGFSVPHRLIEKLEGPMADLWLENFWVAPIAS